MVSLTGTQSQIDWAEPIRERAGAEFDRVAIALSSIPDKRIDGKQSETETILAILRDKRAEVMANTHAGYFISQWRELHDQVRQLITADPRYQLVRANRAPRQQPE